MELHQKPKYSFEIQDSVTKVNFIYSQLDSTIADYKLKLLKNDGWQLVRTRGSHRQFKHPEKKGLVTVSGKPADDVKKGTLGSVLRQANIKHT